MNRVLVIGPGGAGKTTLAIRLGALRGLPVVHLDREYWRPGWIPTPKAEWTLRVRELLADSRWILDGNYSGTLGERVASCDTVIFLDFPRRVYLPRVLQRRFRFRGRTRPDVASGCPERITLQFLAWLWRYPTRTRPRLVSILDECRRDKIIVHLNSDREVNTYLRTLQ